MIRYAIETEHRTLAYTDYLAEALMLARRWHMEGVTVYRVERTAVWHSTESAFRPRVR